jgi:hypothetical protein
MLRDLMTIVCAVTLAQTPAPSSAELPELKPGDIIQVSTGRETITGTVEQGGTADFLRLQVPGTPTPTYIRRSAVETIRVLPVVAAAIPATPPVGPDRNRHLVYVHGICRHSAGFSKPWWEAMKASTPRIDESNVHEVVWSDVVYPAMAARAPGVPPPPAAPQPVRTEEQRRLAESIRAILRDRAEQAGAEGGASPAAPSAPGARGYEMAAPASLFGGLAEAIECADDFVLYMTVSSVREEALGRFDQVVRPLLESGASIEIISHSWGTVIAYEGLRRLEAPTSTPLPGRVHNLFTVGSALSIWPVRLNLAERVNGGDKPRSVNRWVNIDARFDIVGGHIQGAPFAVDVERLDLPPVGCSFPVFPTCAHGSYFNAANLLVNRSIFGLFIAQ